MATTLTLTATSDGVEPNEDGVLIVADGTEVVLTVSTEPDLDPSRLQLLRDDVALPTTFTAATTKSATATVTAAGAYRVTHSDGGKSNAVTVSAEVADGGGGDGAVEPPVVVETGFGVLDGRFLWITLLVLLVGVIGVVVLVGRQVRFHNNLTSAWGEAPFALRSAAEIQWTVGGVGAGLLMVGAWLAALETRGRLKGPTSDQPVPGVRGLGAEIGTALVGVVEKLRTTRGTIAVLVVGTVLLLAVLWASTSVANHEGTKTPELPAKSSTTPAVTDSTVPASTAR